MFFNSIYPLNHTAMNNLILLYQIIKIKLHRKKQRGAISYKSIAKGRHFIQKYLRTTKQDKGMQVLKINKRSTLVQMLKLKSVFIKPTFTICIAPFKSHFIYSEILVRVLNSCKCQNCDRK